MTARRGWLAVCALTLLSLAGCGIRPTEVPVDAGPAPTRATCDTRPELVDGATSDVYLLCGSHIESVRRPVELPGQDDRVAVAEALLAELQSHPEDDEREAGFTSEVPASLRVTGPEADDPAPALRLSSKPSELTAVALVQIICTFAHSDSLGGNGHTVLLGGPGSHTSEAPRPYTCTSAMRTSPEAAHSPVDVS
ncbi:hypothetical protein [Streptomyces radicis]|uniref:Lipoprotein n=1 Tax=Streptomyces radicis TaxID=1750517 RepID=A0A3A9VWX5_9ACTN|nr:hypothetical protein [Streptomyces radicis]RKN05250.1 hypothetical protein D7319_26150 [Streptomyces radicis]RKN16783.1 hypothetical protein D7318_25515 [Streptomyces radicis]